MWFDVSATMEWIMVSSSATCARCGNSSDTQRPAWPLPKRPVRLAQLAHLSEEDIGFGRRLQRLAVRGD